MRASSSQNAALLAITVSLAVLSAGCVAQDRPHEASFYVVADAGHSEVATAGDTLHFEWAEAHALEAEGGTEVHEEVEVEWRTSTHAEGNHSEFNFTPSQEGLILVELNVTAKDHTASDAAAVLVLPSAIPPGGRLYVASLGDFHLEPETASSTSHQDVQLGSFEGEEDDYPLLGGPFHTFHFAFAGDSLEAEGTLLFAVKPTSGAVRAHASPPLSLDPFGHFSLVIDASPAQTHRVLTRDAAGAVTNNTTLADFEAVHAAEHEAKVLVAPAGAKLPGFEGAAVASAVALASLVALRRRR